MKRKLTQVLLGSFLVVFLTAFIPLIHSDVGGRAQAAEKLTIQTWGGLHTEACKNAYFIAFTEDTGVEIVEALAGPDYFAKLAAQVKSKNIEWDVVSGADYPSVAEAWKKGLLEEIDYSIVTETQDWMPSGLMKWGLGHQFQVNLMIYNTNKFPGDDHPKSWADFFDAKKFPGPRAFHNWGQDEDSLFVALLADGVPPEKLVPIDFERAFKKWDQIKPDVKVWYTSGDKLMQVLLDEEVVLAGGTDGRGKAAKWLGAPIAFEYEGAMVYVSYWSVVKGTPRRELAMQFLNYIAGHPGLHAIFTNYMGYGTPNRKAIRYVHPKFQKDEAVHPDNLNKLVLLDTKQFDWVVEHKTEITERWQSWLAK